MSERLITVVGPGLMGRQHLDLIERNPETVVNAIVVSGENEYDELAREYNIPIFDSLEESIANARPDGVIISSPNQFHFEHAAICINANIPVLIEKPITASVEEGEKLLSMGASHHARALVGHHRAHSPLLTHARDIISSGRIGELVTVIGSAQFYKPADYFREGAWRTLKGGGPILINLIHEIGNLRALMGEISAVQAITSSARRKFEVEDTAAINFLFKNGALGTFMLSDTAASAKSWEMTSGENPVYPFYGDEDCYVVTGTLGSLSVPDMKLRFYADRQQASWWTGFVEEDVPVNRKNPLECQLDNFVRVINNEEKPLVSMEDGLRNLKITEAVINSAENKTLITI
jgi:predicted dehydrogenase